MRLGVIIPAYNERVLLPKLFEWLSSTPPPVMPDGTPCERFIVLVDDGSTDGTAEVVRGLGERPGVFACVHEKNRGKGAALRTGLERAIAEGADVVIVQDADLEYDPADHQPVLDPILKGQADAVIGSRFIGQTHRVLYFWHYLANRFLTLCSNMLTNLNLSDMECCFKAMTREVAGRIEIRERRFGVEPEMVAKLSRMRIADEQVPGRVRMLRIYEVAVSYAGRTYAEGKKIGWRDGVSALRCILRYNLFG